ncbi:uracil phosphoribosyltransferase-domain-containing protein [Poronia punctata]|nr:uracil phosphoribosyltransferase-domain-containing protein [Poronia punctata]
MPPTPTPLDGNPKEKTLQYLTGIMSNPYGWTPNEKKGPVIIGLYGLPGCGKTFLLNTLSRELGSDNFKYYEGSKVIESLVPGGLDEFRGLPKEEKVRYRESAISIIQKECAESRKAGIVTGHFMFWEEGKTEDLVYTARDLEIYTHILYLDVNPELMHDRRQNDDTRTRPASSVSHLELWQEAERAQLRALCRQNAILFSLLSNQDKLVDRAKKQIRNFASYDERSNCQQIDTLLSDITIRCSGTILVFDADRTLAPEDAGHIFWSINNKVEKGFADDPLKDLFGGPLGYSSTAFRQATLLYEEVADDHEFDRVCDHVAGDIKMHPEIVSFLRLVKEQKHVDAVVVTCGLGRVWEKVLRAEGLFDAIPVIGGGRIDAVNVTPLTKRYIVESFKAVGKYVVAFGDSPMDMPMLSQAHLAVVIVGEKKYRSETMDDILRDAVLGGSRVGLKFDHRSLRQLLLPSRSSPRLPNHLVPIVKLQGRDFLYSVLRHRKGPDVQSQIIHATDEPATKFLARPMRDARVSGPSLRKAHHNVGKYLAVQFLTQVLGLEVVRIPHVQGKLTDGHYLRWEDKTAIVALMRGGEPMASGVNSALPRAMLIHAKDPVDVTMNHLKEKRVVVLVDSVVNTGKSVVEFIRHIRSISTDVLIVVVAGVVQNQCTVEGELADILSHDYRLFLVALRLSQNKYKGSGMTDTGNRLFNTPTLL